MSTPTYTAGSTLFPSNGSYRAGRLPAVRTSVVVAQQDPCAIVRPGGGGGGGGTGPKPRRCAANQRCCEPAPNGLCFLCVRAGLQCP
jgi:hypothetical protein